MLVLDFSSFHLSDTCTPILCPPQKKPIQPVSRATIFFQILCHLERCLPSAWVRPSCSIRTNLFLILGPTFRTKTNKKKANYFDLGLLYWCVISNWKWKHSCFLGPMSFIPLLKLSRLAYSITDQRTLN